MSDSTLRSAGLFLFSLSAALLRARNFSCFIKDLHHHKAQRWYEDDAEIVVSLVSITLQLLVIVAFMLDERVIAAYVDAVGWPTFAITGGFGLAAIVSWMWKL